MNIGYLVEKITDKLSALAKKGHGVFRVFKLISFLWVAFKVLYKVWQLIPKYDSFTEVNGDDFIRAVEENQSRRHLTEEKPVI